MRTNWIGKTVVGMSLAVACAVPACDTSKSEDLGRTTQPATGGMLPGDVAITCFNSVSTNPLVDFVQLMPLRAIDKDTDLRLTDREATATGEFNTNDNEAINELIPLTGADAGATVIEAGTPILFTPVTGLGNGTEQVFIYQGVIGATADAGTLTGGSFLWGLQNAPGGMWAGARDDAANLSARLNVLAAGDNDTVLNSTTANNTWFYDTARAPTSGTKAALRAAIHDPLNWSVATTAGSSAQCPKSLTVVPDATDGGNDVPVGADGGGTGGSGTGGSGTGGRGTGGSGTGGSGTGGVTGTGGSGTGGSGTGGVTGTGGSGTGGSGTGGTGTGGRGTGGSGTGGVTGTGGTGTGGSGTGGSGTGGVIVTGTGGTGTGGSSADAGAGGSGTGGSGTGGASDGGTGTGGRGTGGSGAGGAGTGGSGAGGAAGSAADAGTDIRVDGGTGTDVKVDTGTGTDAKVDTGTDAVKADAKADAKAPSSGGGGCGCSTTSTRESLGAGAWMMALVGIVFTARRRRRKQ